MCEPTHPSQDFCEILENGEIGVKKGKALYWPEMGTVNESVIGFDII